VTNTPASPCHITAGAAAELVWIIAQHNGLSVQPISPVFPYARTRSELDELSPTFADEFAELQRDFHTLAGIPNESTVPLLRFTIGPPPSVHSRRNPQRVQIS
jgi:hypothetical protein